MKLKSYSIGNFKSFGFPAQEIPLKPITLIFGANSAGKSSILHSLLWLNHTLRTGETDVRFPMAAEGQVDLGGFNQFIHQQDTSKRMTVSTKLGTDILPPEAQRWLNIQESITVDFSFGYSKRQDSGKPIVLDFILKFDGKDFLRAAPNRDGSLKLITLDLRHPCMANLLGSIGAPQQSDAGSPSDEAGPQYDFLEAMEALLSRYIETSSFSIGLSDGLPTSFNTGELIPPNDPRYTGDEQLALMALSPAERNSIDHVFQEGLPDSLTAALNAIHEAIKKDLGSIQYVPPLRELPPRYTDLRGTSPLWQQLFENPDLLGKINDWLGQDSLRTRYELEATEFVARKKLESELPDFVRREIARTLLYEDEFTHPMAETVDFKSIRSELIYEFLLEDLEEILNANPEIRREMEEHEYDAAENDSVSGYYDTESRGWHVLTEEEKRQQIRENLNWEPHVSAEAFDDNGCWAFRLFRFWLGTAALSDWLVKAIDDSGDISQDVSTYLEQTASLSETRREIGLRVPGTNTRVSLQDVGVGISQVLPVLLQAYGQKDNLIAIEQPEIHIHPALQAELGDLFIESALGENKNTFLIETHSEHLILRLLRRIRETTRKKLPEKACPISPKDIAVLFVSQDEDGTDVRELRIDDQGRFIDNWPGGFFEESFNEMF